VDNFVDNDTPGEVVHCSLFNVHPENVHPDKQGTMASHIPSLQHTNILSSWSHSVTTFLDNVFHPVGQTWQGYETQTAWDAGKLCSVELPGRTTTTTTTTTTTSQTTNSHQRSLRVVFRNLTSMPLLLCWVSENGVLHHFYRLDPWDATTVSEITAASSAAAAAASSHLKNDNHDAAQEFIKDCYIAKTDHIEYTEAGHAFCWIHVEREEDLTRIQTVKSLKGSSALIVGGFRPYLPKFNDNDNSNGMTTPKVQLVTISQQTTRPSPFQNRISSCFPFCREKRLGNLRKRKMHDDMESDWDKKHDHHHDHWNVQARWGKFDMTPLETTTKIYEETTIGGWPCCVEPNWSDGDQDLEQRLADDLAQAAKYLPNHAEVYLKQHCKIWINKSLSWGSKACPVKGMALCYHPDRTWLIENGLHAEKHQCVEISCASFYNKDCHLWGPGGLFLHELCHAYHHSLLPDGYQNKDIEECFQHAMNQALYEKVPVHGSQGPTARAYACTNAMEYWAELSTAFLGGLNKKEEYNKWYPFNRHQLKEHDPRAFDVLSKLWQANAIVKK
jgi:hypothetical protein